MRGYLALAKRTIMVMIVYRAGFFFSMAANIIGITILHFLWKAIYAGTPVMNGLDFNAAFTSVALSTTLYTMICSYIDENMCNSITDGTITKDLLRPGDYQLYLFSQTTGGLVLNMCIIALPSILALIFIFRIAIPVGWNILFFTVAIIFSAIINFLIDYIVGLISFYTLSAWGLSAAKSVTIMIMSGAIVPLAFFPESIRRVAEVLPFRAMFAIPMQMLLSDGTDILFYLKSLGIQLFWILVLGIAGRLFFRQAIKVVTVQGG